MPSRRRRPKAGDYTDGLGVVPWWLIGMATTSTTMLSRRSRRAARIIHRRPSSDVGIGRMLVTAYGTVLVDPLVSRQLTNRLIGLPRPAIRGHEGRGPAGS